MIDFFVHYLKLIIGKNVLQPLAKSVLMSLGLTPAASATDAGVHEKILGSGTRKLKKSNEEMKDIMKMVKSLEDSGLLIKVFTRTI